MDGSCSFLPNRILTINQCKSYKDVTFDIPCVHDCGLLKSILRLQHPERIDLNMLWSLICRLHVVLGKSRSSRMVFEKRVAR
jgi:hypothetical protein